MGKGYQIAAVEGDLHGEVGVLGGYEAHELVDEVVDPLTGARRNEQRMGIAGREGVQLVWGEGVDLVEDRHAADLAGVDLSEHVFHRCDLMLVFGRRGVDDVQDRIGLADLFERALEGFHERGG